MKICIACGMPMIKKEDFACGDENMKTCVHCTNEDGSIKNAEEIFNGGVEFFVQTAGMERDFAEKITRKNMADNCPYWQGRDEPILKGEKATDAEFEKVVAELMS